MLPDEVFFRQGVGEDAGEDDLLDVRSLVDGHGGFFILGVRVEARGFRDEDGVAVLRSWMHGCGLVLEQK